MRHTALVLGLVMIASAASAACSSEFDLFGARGSDKEGEDKPAPGAAGTTPPTDVRDPTTEKLPDPLAAFPKGAEQLAKVCARGQNNKVTQALCDNPQIGSLKELEEMHGLRFGNPGPSGSNGTNGNAGFALLGHSSSLVAHNVSAINPRAFVFNAPPGRPQRVPGFVVIGFARGEPFVEIIAEDAQTRELGFYLLKFDPECELTHTCTNADLFTPEIERNWKSWSLYDDEDLKNNILDCRHCHQPNVNFKPGLRMQELQDPWTHWFRNDRPGGVALFIDYLRVHADEDYGGIPAAIVQKADGRAMEDLVTGAGFGGQPNMFDSEQIEAEVRASASQQPEVNLPAGRSQTGQSLYDAAARGEAIPPPYHDVKVTDPDKLLFASDAYLRYRNGTLAKSDFPDIRRVFLDEALEDLNFRPKTGFTGKQILIQACAQCHNPLLDQGISRAKFDVSKLDTMDRASKDKAIARMLMPRSELGHMPPAIFRSLPKEALDLAVAELKK